MISIFPGRPRLWASSASSRVNLTLLSLILSPVGRRFSGLLRKESPSRGQRFAATTWGNGPQRRPFDTNADDGAISPAEGGGRRCAAFLSHGRLFRAVLRRRQGG